MRRYTEHYAYDGVGNFLRMIHQADGGSWTRDYAYEDTSLIEANKPCNRLSRTTVSGASETYAHDTHGNVTTMPHLPMMHWSFNDQLYASARQVVNEGSAQRTWYVYDAAGRRVRKITEGAAPPGNTPSRRNERIYVGGFELFHAYAADGATVTLERETLHVLDDQERVAMVETRTQGGDGSPQQLVRYQLGNHLGSACLELDAQAAVISYEEYHPFGSTSYQAAAGALDRVRSDIDTTARNARRKPASHTMTRGITRPGWHAGFRSIRPA